MLLLSGGLRKPVAKGMWPSEAIGISDLGIRVRVYLESRGTFRGT